MTDDGRLLTHLQYDDILRQQIFISSVCNGISFEDTDKMSYYDRKFILNELLEQKKKEQEALKEFQK